METHALITVLPISGHCSLTQLPVLLFPVGKWNFICQFWGLWCNQSTISFARDGKQVLVSMLKTQKKVVFICPFPACACYFDFKSDGTELVFLLLYFFMVYVSAALIQQSTTVKRKDIRKFLDGIYVSEKTTIVQEENN